MKSKISTHIGIFFLKILAKFPFNFIYFLSDIFYIVIYYLIGYRKKVVFKNLKNAFPEKSITDLKSITKKYYRHFCDITLETIKMTGMKSSDFSKRFKIKNPEVINAYFEKGVSVILLTLHYNNWEWNICLQLRLKHQILGVYKPLHNEVFDVYLNNIRSKFRSEMIQNANILRRVIQAHQNNEPVITWLAGDQTPPYFHKSWFQFLNQEALFYTGPAALSQRFNQPIFLQKTIKTGRGKYETSFELLFENPREYSENEILKKYISKIEEIIHEKPEFYLWSHKRWKHKRPENIPLNE